MSKGGWELAVSFGTDGEVVDAIAVVGGCLAGVWLGFWRFGSGELGSDGGRWSAVPSCCVVGGGGVDVLVIIDPRIR